MCGINGIALSSKRRSSIDRSLLPRMRDVIAHRGPDDTGIFVAGPVGLGHRRLSIVDVSAGHQPMSNEDGLVTITYNGEIYNHSDYRESLESKGHVYKTHCDTETILHLYEEYGADCVSYLRGMFAFAIWDERRKTLFAARDRIGIKPFHYYIDSEQFAFASEIKSLLEISEVERRVDTKSLADCFVITALKQTSKPDRDDLVTLVSLLNVINQAETPRHQCNQTVPGLV